MSKYESKMEFILGLFLIPGLLLFYSDYEFSSLLLGLSFSTLAIFYFLISFIPSIEKSPFKIIADRTVNIGSSICVMGIMYKILNLPGAEIMFNVGLASMIISIIVLTSLKIWNQKIMRLVLRILIITAMGLSL